MRGPLAEGALGRLEAALHRCRPAIVSIALTYAVSLLVGAAMVHAGSGIALDARDALVSQAHEGDPAARALAGGRPFEAGVIDFARNVILVAVPTTVAGLAIVVPYPFVVYRGWVGGIVSVDREHASRLADPREAAYYLITLALQLVPSCLTGGAGVALGLAYVRRRPADASLFGFPRVALVDVGAIYALAVPLFFVASMWEFLAR